MALNLAIPERKADLKPRIVVLGVGGAGGNAVNTMIQSELQGVEFVVANTDAQALAQSLSENTIQLGGDVTRGLGAGSKPEIGAAAADESIQDVLAAVQDANLVFIAAGMGGGTGTGAAPVIAKATRDLGILTVAVVTKPFRFEGAHRSRLADDGIDALQSNVDTLITIPNQNLFRVANERTTFADAFKMADDVLYEGVRGISDLMVQPGLINLDFADVRSLMSVMGKAMMGLGEGEGDCRAIEAAEAAISNPLLEDASMRGTKGVLINIAGGNDLTLFEVDEAANRIREEVDPEANIIFGSSFDPVLQGRIRISVVATGIVADAASATQQPYQSMRETVSNTRRMPASSDQPAYSQAPNVQPAPQLAPVPAPASVSAPQAFVTPQAPMQQPAAEAPQHVAATAVSQPIEQEQSPYPETAEQPPYMSSFDTMEANVEQHVPHQPEAQMPPAAPLATPSYLNAIQNPVHHSTSHQMEARDVTSQHMNRSHLQAVPVAEPTHELKAEMPAAASSTSTSESGFAKSAGLFSRIQNFAKSGAQSFGGDAQPELNAQPQKRQAQPAAISDLFAQSPQPYSTTENTATSYKADPNFDEDLLEIPAFLRKQAN
ncbi:MAG: cell division protein FtsZ [Alphaproteobacteria bacterium]